MGTRRLSREQALQALFYMDMHRDPDGGSVGSFCNAFTEGNPAEPYFRPSGCGVQENRQTIDSVIEQFSSNWKLSRMSCVDRNVLRIAAFEIALFAPTFLPKSLSTRPLMSANASAPKNPVPLSTAFWTACG
jgi:N utilization substance protein B